MTPAELSEMDALSQVAAIRDGSLSSGEAAEAAIAGAQAVDPALNCIVHERYDRARAEAAAAARLGAQVRMVGAVGSDEAGDSVLAAMTAAAVALGVNSTSVDLTSTTTGTYGTDAQNTAGSVRTLWHGDVNFDGAVKYTGSGNDRDPILTTVGGTTPNNSVVGYQAGDINLDGSVKYTGSGNDRDPILINVGSTTPNNTRVATLP